MEPRANPVGWFCLSLKMLMQRCWYLRGLSIFCEREGGGEHKLTHSHPHPLIVSHRLTHSQSVTDSPTHTLTHSHPHPLTPSSTHSQSQTHPLTLSPTHTLTVSHRLTHSHTHYSSHRIELITHPLLSLHTLPHPHCSPFHTLTPSTCPHFTPLFSRTHTFTPHIPSLLTSSHPSLLTPLTPHTPHSFHASRTSSLNPHISLLLTPFVFTDSTHTLTTPTPSPLHPLTTPTPSPLHILTTTTPSLLHPLTTPTPSPLHYSHTFMHPEPIITISMRSDKCQTSHDFGWTLDKPGRTCPENLEGTQLSQLSCLAVPICNHGRIIAMYMYVQARVIITQFS